MATGEELDIVFALAIHAAITKQHFLRSTPLLHTLSPTERYLFVRDNQPIDFDALRIGHRSSTASALTLIVRTEWLYHLGGANPPIHTFQLAEYLVVGESRVEIEDISSRSVNVQWWGRVGGRFVIQSYSGKHKVASLNEN